MNIIEQDRKFIVHRTIDDQGEVYPQYIWRDPVRHIIDVIYDDVDGKPSMQYVRDSMKPVIRRTSDPSTFVSLLRPAYEWEVYINGSPTGEMIVVPVYALPDEPGTGLYL